MFVTVKARSSGTSLKPRWLVTSVSCLVPVYASSRKLACSHAGLLLVRHGLDLYTLPAEKLACIHVGLLLRCCGLSNIGL